MSSKRSCENVEVVAKKVKKEEEEAPKTPARRFCPCPPEMRRRHQVRHFSKLLEGRVMARFGMGTPVKIWPRAFWTARRNLYEECEDLRPATPVKICPPGPPPSPQDIFK